VSDGFSSVYQGAYHPNASLALVVRLHGASLGGGGREEGRNGGRVSMEKPLPSLLVPVPCLCSSLFFLWNSSLPPSLPPSRPPSRPPPPPGRCA
jgi:hypothetical protein